MSLYLEYEGVDQNLNLLIFKPTNFRLPLISGNPRLTWMVEGELAYRLVTQCESVFCWYDPEVNPEIFAQAQLSQTNSFLPEQHLGELSIGNSKLYASNHYAVVGRNPVRVIFMPRDDQGVAVKLESPPEIVTQAQLITDSTLVLDDDPQFYDFVSQQPLKTTVSFKVDDQLELTTTVYFAPNCKNDPKYCLKHPQQAWWYLKSWLGDKQRLLQEKIYKMRTY